MDPFQYQYFFFVLCGILYLFGIWSILLKNRVEGKYLYSHITLSKISPFVRGNKVRKPYVIIYYKIYCPNSTIYCVNIRICCYNVRKILYEYTIISLTI
jgi:hypothetical protein